MPVSPPWSTSTIFLLNFLRENQRQTLSEKSTDRSRCLVLYASKTSPQKGKGANPAAGGTKHGAGNGARTRDTKLGKLVLYQLSYARVTQVIYNLFWGLSNLFRMDSVKPENRRSGFQKRFDCDISQTIEPEGRLLRIEPSFCRQKVFVLEK